MLEENAIKDLSKDAVCNKILDALCTNDLTHDEIIAMGSNPRQMATMIEMLQAAGIIEAYCAPIRPSSCSYRLTGRH